MKIKECIVCNKDFTINKNKKYCCNTCKNKNNYKKYKNYFKNYYIKNKDNKKIYYENYYIKNKVEILKKQKINYYLFKKEIKNN